MHTGISIDEFQYPPQGEPKAKPTDEHAHLCLTTDTLTGELCQHFFRFRGIGAHERLSIDPQVEMRVMRMQSQFRTIRCACLGELEERFQQAP